MSYRVMIVEDESGIVEGLKFLIHRFMPQCQVETLASDGQDGYRKALSSRPEILLTDVRMPQMDGIEMIRKLREAGLETHYVILSGYAEFEYARSAIQLGVEEYITKPVDEEELCNVLKRIMNIIDSERCLNQRNEQMNDQVREYMLRDFLDGKFAGGEEARSKLVQVGLPVDCKSYLCIMLEKDVDSRADRDFFCGEIKELIIQYIDFCKEQIVISYSENLAVAILFLSREIESRSIRNRVGIIRLALAEKMDCTVTAGIGMLHYQPEGIRESFEEARCTINYKLIKGLDSCITFEQIKDIDSGSEWISQEDIRMLEKGIDELNDAACRQAIDAIFYKVQREKNLSMEQLQTLSLNILLVGLRKVPFIQFQMNEYMGRNIFSLENISKFQTIEQLKNWILNTLQGMNELMLKESLPTKRDIIEEAKAYIKKNFNRDISLNDISDRFFINPYYFSQLFKKKTGDTYQNYLIELRISRAKKLLEETDLKIYEICSMVGYSDTNHFNKVFERSVGMKPSEYKKQIMTFGKR